MFSKIRKHCNATTLIALAALVFAMTGGAFAMSGASTSTGSSSRVTLASALATTAKAKPKAKAGPRGPAGPKGATGATGASGPAGPAGATGPAGAAGGKGENGSAGAAGTNGTNGTSVTSGQFTGAKGPTCKEGGSEFTAGSTKTYACNGSPWTAGGTLPKGATEAGAWSVTTVENAVSPGSFYGKDAISFGIPLSSAPTVEFVKQGEEGKEHASECPATTWEVPKATEGFLCIYTGNEALATFGTPEAFTVGAELEFSDLAAGLSPHGTWAVTAG